MKVVFIHAFSGGFGGAERYLELLAPALAERQIATSVFLVGDSQETQLAQARLSSLGLDCRVIPTEGSAWQLRRLIKEHSPDVVHWNLSSPAAFGGCRPLLLIWGPRHVLTEHLPSLRSRRADLWRQIANVRVSRVIVVSEAARVEYDRRWLVKRPVRAVRNGVPWRGASERPRKASNNTGVRLGFVGRLVDQKNPSLCLHILAGLRAMGVDATLDIVGDGPLRTELQALGDRLAVTPWISWHGFTNDVGPVLMRIDLLLAPSVNEGFAFVPLEALAAGVPAVLSDIPPHRELEGLSNGCAVTVASPASGPWVDVVSSLLSELQERADQTSALRTTLGLDAMIDRTLSVYRDAVGGPGRLVGGVGH